MISIQNELHKDTLALIKSTINSRKGGVPFNKIDVEFKRLAGHNIPYDKLNFSCLKDYVRSLPGIRIAIQRGEERLFVTNSKAGHIAKLVENQKDRFDKRFKNSDSSSSSSKGVNFKKSRNGPNRRSRSISSTSTRFSSKSDSCSDVRSYGSSRQSSIDIVIDPYRKAKQVYEPIAYHQQLIGDDFFLQLAIRELHVNNLWRKHDKAAITTGLCVSGQTIRDCVKRLKKIDSISNRVVVMLGTVDIYKGREFNQMMHDFDELLFLLEKKFLLSKSAITLCTIPPLANVPVIGDHRRLCTLYTFNNYIRWLENQDRSSLDTYGFLDFYKNFINNDMDQQNIDFDSFQVEARMVSGCPNPHVLWNNKGRKTAMELLRCSSLGQKTPFSPF